MANARPLASCDNLVIADGLDRDERPHFDLRSDHLGFRGNNQPIPQKLDGLADIRLINRRIGIPGKRLCIGCLNSLFQNHKPNIVAIFHLTRIPIGVRGQ
jgi:hypothetical protein